MISSQAFHTFSAIEMLKKTLYTDQKDTVKIDGWHAETTLPSGGFVSRIVNSVKAWAADSGKVPTPVPRLCSVQFSLSVVSDSLQPHGLQHARPPCPSPTPIVYSNSCPLSRWCHPTISSSIIPFSSCLQSFPASGSFPMSQFFQSGGESIGVSPSASVLLMNI